jgi:hypothetical protein
MVSAIEQTILIWLSLYYIRNRRRRRVPGVLGETTEDDDDDDETSQSEIDQLSDAFASDFVKSEPKNNRGETRMLLDDPSMDQNY